MMDNHTNSQSHAGGYGTQASQAYNNNNYRDPLEHYSESKNSASGSKSNFSFLDTFILHGQVQSYESELQFLNSNKSDQGGTSVGISDSKLRFLVIKSQGIVFVSFWSMFLNFIAFALLFINFSQLFAVVISALMLMHAFFPAYIIYAMKRFVIGEKFTKKFYKKMLNVWRFFEFMYLSFFGVVLYLQQLDWVVVRKEIIEYFLSIKIIGKLIAVYFSKIPVESLSLMFEVYGLVMLVGIIGYLIMAYLRNKEGVKEQEKILFDHSRETLRPIQLCRIAAGKLKIRN